AAGRGAVDFASALLAAFGLGFAPALAGALAGRGFGNGTAATGCKARASTAAATRLPGNSLDARMGLRIRAIKVPSQEMGEAEAADHRLRPRQKGGDLGSAREVGPGLHCAAVGR